MIAGAARSHSKNAGGNRQREDQRLAHPEYRPIDRDQR